MAKGKALGTKKRKELEALFLEHGISDFKWIDPKDIIVSQWVRMKCAFGCGEYGRNATCPPNTPSVAECDKFSRSIRRPLFSIFRKRSRSLRTVTPGLGEST
jgi:predicted metal-binding protein